MIRFDCVTLFPEMFAAVTDWGITRRALGERIVECRRCGIRGISPRTITARSTTGRTAGGPGMVMLVEPLEKAIAAAKAAAEDEAKVIYLSPQGAPLTHRKVAALAQERRVALLCAGATKAWTSG